MIANLIKAELYKLVHNKALWILPLALVLFSSISIFSGTYDSAATAFEVMSEDSMSMLLGLSVFAAAIVAADFRNRSLTHYIAAGHSRASIVLVKFLMLMIGSTVTVFAYPIIGTVLTGFICGWGAPVGALFVTMATTLLKMLPLMLCLVSVFMVFDVVIPNIIGSIGASLVVLIAGVVFTNKTYGANPASLIRYSPVIQVSLAHDNAVGSAWGISIGIGIVLTLVCLAASLVVYCNREVK
ncbi:MAG: ABC transporter permease [Bifidobacteriaceae bacterium]|jgi:ABC-type transport system involved in multi-copper enzyme maturation permease subunit|nr:ABC transporter permease [Bifidobacteriaceae bacterium]MCI1978685.1 ABC transporter permease [Bifidobacteriaceae bacterium]